MLYLLGEISKNVTQIQEWVSATGTVSTYFAQFSVARGKKAATRFMHIKRAWAARQGTKKCLNR